MNFEQILKEEWEKEFTPDNECNYSNSIFNKVFKKMFLKIMARVWNEAIDKCADNATADYNILDSKNEYGDSVEVYVLKESILQHKLKL